MKRVLVFLLAATMILGMLAICSSANDLNEPFEYRDEAGEIIPFERENVKGEMETVESQKGLVHKIPADVGVTVDGQKEAFYTQGLTFNISRLNGNADYPVSGTGYIVYDDLNLYAFIEANDPIYFNIGEYVTICPECGKQRGQASGCAHMAEGEYDKRPGSDASVNLWDDDCIEFMIDWSNDGSVPSQYRISRSGYMSRDYDTYNTGFSGKGYNAGETWGAEFSIPLDSSAKGTQLGVTVMIHSQNTLSPFDETWAMDCNYNATGSPWHPDYFDYIELGDILEGASNEVKPPEGGGGTIVPTPIPGPGQPGPGPGQHGDDPNPGTADPMVYIILVAVVSLGAAVVVKKTCFNK